MVIAPQNAREAVHAAAERHAWWAAGFGIIAIGGFMVAAISLLMPSADAALYVRSFFLIGVGATIGSRRRSSAARVARRCTAAIARGAEARLLNGGIEVTLDVSFTQRIELSSSATAKLTAQLVPPARARLT